MEHQLRNEDQQALRAQGKAWETWRQALGTQSSTPGRGGNCIQESKSASLVGLLHKCGDQHCDATANELSGQPSEGQMASWAMQLQLQPDSSQACHLTVCSCASLPYAQAAAWQPCLSHLLLLLCLINPSGASCCGCSSSCRVRRHTPSGRCMYNQRSPTASTSCT